MKTEKSALQRLREGFDLAYEAPERALGDPEQAYLRVGTGERDYLMPLWGVRRLVAAPVLTFAPSPIQGFLGISSVLHELFPVYDLSRLLGGTAAGKVRFMALLAEQPVALAFERFSGQVRLPVIALQSTGSPFMENMAVLEQKNLATLDLRALVQSLKSQILPYQGGRQNA